MSLQYCRQRASVPQIDAPFRQSTHSRTLTDDTQKYCKFFILLYISKFNANRNLIKLTYIVGLGILRSCFPLITVLRENAHEFFENEKMLTAETGSYIWK